jgi:hypothetical protein
MSLYRTPVIRIFLAIVISILLHVAILWLPHVQLSRGNLLLPPITVKLQPLPKIVAQAAALPEVASRASRPDNNASENSISHAVESLKEMDKSSENRLFPKHLFLAFDVYESGGIFRVAETHHQLDINKDNYNLRAIKKAVVLPILQATEQFSQTSQGKVSEQGLRPDLFKEERVAKGRKQRFQTVFDWEGQSLSFVNEKDVALPVDTQDPLSFMYQLSQISMNSEIITLSIADGASLEGYRIEIRKTEDIDTPMGILRTLHLRKMHSHDEPYFEIWLALEYRLLPVMFRQMNSANEVIEEMVISDMRASDE